MSAIKEHLKKLLSLLEIERDEDRLQFRNLLLSKGIGERKKEGITLYPITIDDIRYLREKRLIITFEAKQLVEQEHHFQYGKVVNLFQNAQNKEQNNPFQSGTIKDIKNDKISVYFDIEDTEDWMDEGKLGLDLLFDEVSYREMAKALDVLLKTENKDLTRLMEVFYGEKQATFNATSNTQISSPFLNDSQNKGLQKSLSANELSIIHGPPGTGKTTTLVECIKQILNTEKKVLVCAQSNTAVDLLTERLSKRGIKVVRIGNPARVSEELYRLTLDAKTTEHPDSQTVKKLRKQSSEFRRLASQYKRKFGKDEYLQRKTIIAEARLLEGDAERIENQISEDILSASEVIACTLVGSSSFVLKGLSFNTVVIDESAQALEPACWIPILKAKRVILSGDHHQLPPTVKSQKAMKEGLSYSLFERAIKNQPQASVMLLEQYRMHSQIMDYSNNWFYNKELVAHPSVRDKLICPSTHQLSQPIIFIDTAGKGFEEKKGANTISLVNEDEGRLLLQYLENFLLELETFDTSMVDNYKIGIIAPYKAQVDFLRKEIHEFPTPWKWIKNTSINTIDGFQGQERDVICFSLVRSNDKSEIGFLSDLRRLNVALTRAKMKLILIGDSATLSSHPFFEGLIEYITLKDGYISAWELSL